MEDNKEAKQTHSDSRVPVGFFRRIYRQKVNDERKIGK
jgi:hypothetical protein